MNWKNSIVVIIPILTILIVGFVLQYNTVTDTKTDPIRIGITTWSGDAHAFIAIKKGFFEKNNVQVELYY